MTTYTAKDIEVLEGLEPVRKRPAMYIGGTDKPRLPPPALGDRRQRRSTRPSTATPRGSRSRSTRTTRARRVIDDGRGIPVDMHPKYKRSALELILCTLHAGGKFDGEQLQGRRAACTASARRVVNALSERLDGHACGATATSTQQTFSRGVPHGQAQEGSAPRASTAPTIHFRPDPQIFGNDAQVRRRRRCASASRPRLPARRAQAHRSSDEATGDDGRASTTRAASPTTCRSSSPSSGKRADARRSSFTLERENEPAHRGRAAVDRGHRRVRSARYANGIPTRQGGTHESGLKRGDRARRSAASCETKKIEPKGVHAHRGGHPRGRRRACSASTSPSRSSRARPRTASTTPRSPAGVEGVVRPRSSSGCCENASDRPTRSSRASSSPRAPARRAARRRSRSLRKTAVSHRLNLPGKLADCCEHRPGRERAVPGRGRQRRWHRQAGPRPPDAGHPAAARQGAQRRARRHARKVLGNKELQDIVSARSAAASARTSTSRKLRYGKIFLLMDADSDGHHISTLLLTFFYRHLPGLHPQGGHVYLAHAAALPHRRRQGDATGRSTTPRRDTRAREAAEEREARHQPLQGSRRDARRRAQGDHARSATSAALLRVIIDDEVETDQVINELMGKDAQRPLPLHHGERGGSRAGRLTDPGGGDPRRISRQRDVEQAGSAVVK